MIISIDFDGTIVHDNYPEIGELKPNVKKILNQIRKDGDTIIINSCRAGVKEQELEQFLINNNLPFDYINKNDPILINLYDIDCRKVSADIYIDDKNLIEIPDDWIDIYILIRRHKNYKRI